MRKKTEIVRRASQRDQNRTAPPMSADGARQNGEPSVSIRDSQAVFMSAISLIVCGIAAYSNSFSGSFVYDDFADIVDNRGVHQLWPLYSPIVTHDFYGWHIHTRPVVAYTFALNYAFCGINPLGYHIVNLAIHLLAGLTLFGFVRRTLLLPSVGWTSGKAVAVALAISLIWTVHPLNTQAVTYVVQRYESMMGLFYLSTMYCALRSMTSSRAGFWRTCSVASCMLAFGSKEVAVSSPIMVLLFDRTFVSGTFGDAWRRDRKIYLGLFGVMLLFAPLFKIYSGSEGNWAGNTIKIAWHQYALSEPGVILHYLRLAFWPSGQCLDYGWPVASSFASIVPPLIIVGGLVVLTIWFSIRRRPAGFAGAWFFLILAPTSSVVPILDLAYEHRMYLSLISVVATTVLAATYVLEHMGSKSISSKRRAAFGVAIAAAVAVALGICTFDRNEVYANGITMWSDVVRKAPDNSRGHVNLGVNLLDNNQVAPAEAELREAMRLDPQSAEVYAQMGRALLQEKDFVAARATLAKAVELRKSSSFAQSNLAVACFELGDLDGAQEHFQLAFGYSPDDSKLHQLYASILLRSSNPSGAKHHLEEALRTEPYNANVMFDLANVLALQGEVNTAIELWEMTLRIAPGHVNAHLNLAKVLAAIGDRSGALAHAEAASRLDPSNQESREFVEKLLASPTTSP
jgi:tetratricopeptide (TPR) repeat protein